jgi:hypothetical protein
MKSFKKAMATIIMVVCVLLPQIVSAAEGIEGEWEFKSQMPGRTSSATMTIAKDANAKYEGKWSAQWGESQLSNINLDNGKLTFVQISSFGDQEMKTTYEGTVEGTKITGKGKGQWGEFNIEGSLQGEPKAGIDAVCGEWQMTVTIPAREIVEKLTITRNADGTLSGKWQAQRGENTISDIKFEAGKLTFTRTSKMGPMEFTSTFEGTVEGDTLKGVFRSERGERAANATRVTSDKPAEGKRPHEGQKPEPNKPASEKKAATEEKPI